MDSALMGGVFVYINTMVTAFAILILSVVVSQYIMFGAIRQLSDEDKMKLLSNKQINRAQRRFIILMAIIAVYYIALTALPGYAVYLFALFIVFIAAERIYMIFTTKRKIAALGLPDFYVKKYIGASIVSSTGLLLFFILLLKELF